MANDEGAEASPLHVETEVMEDGDASALRRQNSRVRLRRAFLAAYVGASLHKTLKDSHDKDDDDDGDGEEARENLTTPWGTARSLINCFVSAGVLGLAFQMAEAGSGTTTLLLVVSAYLIYMTMMFLYDASARYGTTGYVQTVEAAWGRKLALVVLVSLVMEQLGTCISYFNILRDTVPWVLQQSLYDCTEGDEDVDCELPLYVQGWFLIMLITLVIITPISCLSNPDVFGMISFVTWFHFAGFAVLVVMKAADAAGKRADAGLSWWPDEAAAGGAFRFGTSTATSAAVIAFSMAAHSTLLALLYGTAVPKDKVERRGVMAKINGGSIVVVLVYYVLIAAGCFVAFGEEVEGNSLNSFEKDDAFVAVIRCTYTLEIGTSIPLFIYTLRRNLLVLFNQNKSQKQLDDIEKSNLAKTVAGTLFLLALCAVVGLTGSLDIILAFTGAVTATLNAYIFPACLCWTAGRGQALDTNGRLKRHLLAPFCVVLGVVVGVFALLGEMERLFDVKILG